VTRWGILSTARINRKVLAGAAQSDDVEVVAVASRDQGRAEAYAREHGIPTAYGSYDALLADPAIDAVYISLPNALHCPWSIRALEAGKHVLCEKPMSSDPLAVAAVFDVAEAQGLSCMEAFMWRHNAQTRRVEQLVRGGAIGELRVIRSDFGFTLPPDSGDARLASDLDGGSLGDLGCYCISATRLLGGEPESVVARQVLGGGGVDVRFGATLALADDVLAEFHCGFDLPRSHALEVVGSEGSILVEDPWHCVRVGLRLTRGTEVEQIAIELEDSYRLELEDLSRAIRGEGTPLLGRRDAMGQARTIAALKQAARSGHAISLAR
jgi:D-xylose 1-dehydrogenase (NADP+, D-xylono-1,5-lactone-forming)